MILPHRLSLLHASVHARRVVLRESHEGLHEDGDVEDEAEDGVRRGEVLVAGARFVDFYDYEAREEGGEAEEVEEGVDVGACAFLLGSVRGLED